MQVYDLLIQVKFDIAKFQIINEKKGANLEFGRFGDLNGRFGELNGKSKVKFRCFLRKRRGGIIENIRDCLG